MIPFPASRHHRLKPVAKQQRRLRPVGRHQQLLSPPQLAVPPCIIDSIGRSTVTGSHLARRPWKRRLGTRARSCRFVALVEAEVVEGETDALARLDGEEETAVGRMGGLVVDQGNGIGGR